MVYSAEIAEKICEEIATSSKSMKTICAELNLRVPTVLNWLSEGHEGHRPDFCKMYARAKEMQADYMAEEMLDIADDGSNDFMTITKGDETYEVENKEWTSRSKLRLDTRKWIASKLKPKKYGDRLELDGEIKNDSLVPAALVASIAEKLNLNAKPGT